jgi:hypothetical protein
MLLHRLVPQQWRTDHLKLGHYCEFS